MTRFSGLDVLRGLASINVAFLHGITHLVSVDASLDVIGKYWIPARLSVSTFFVLSGFVLSFAQRGSALRLDVSKRFVRLALPVMLAHLAYSVLVRRCEVFSMLRVWLWGDPGYGVLWTVQVEWYGSLLLLLLLRFIDRFEYSEIPLFVICVPWVQAAVQIGALPEYPLIHISAMLAGMFMARWLSAPLYVRGLLIASCAVVPMVSFTNLDLALSLFIVLLFCELWAWENKFLVFAGRVSFALYLLHEIVHPFVTVPLYAYALASLGNSPQSLLVVTLISFCVMFALSEWYYRHIDEPAQKLARWVGGATASSTDSSFMYLSFAFVSLLIVRSIQIK